MCTLWNKNRVGVYVVNPLSADKVKIEFGFNSINRSTDRELFMKRNKYAVIFDGKEKNNLITDYGENDFLITYNNRYYYSFRHFIFNSHDAHYYHFHFFQKNEKILMEVDVVGPSPMRFTESLIDTSLMSKYRCNVPVKSAGYLHNGIKLNRKEE
jgi:hypothetical protein